MSARRTHKQMIVPVMLILLLAVSMAFASRGGFFDLGWFTFEGGGGASHGAQYTLTGSVGQPDLGSVGGGAFSLDGGFLTRVEQNKAGVEPGWWLY